MEEFVKIKNKLKMKKELEKILWVSLSFFLVNLFLLSVFNLLPNIGIIINLILFYTLIATTLIILGISVLVIYKWAKIKINLNEKLFYYLSNVFDTLVKYDPSENEERFQQKLSKNFDEIENVIFGLEPPELGLEIEEKFYNALISFAKSIKSYENELFIYNEEILQNYQFFFKELMNSLQQNDIIKFCETIESKRHIEDSILRKITSRILLKMDKREWLVWTISISIVVIFIVISSIVFNIPFTSNISSFLTALVAMGAITYFVKLIISFLIDLIIK